MTLYVKKAEGVHNVGFVLHEGDGRYSRDVGVVGAGSPALKAGTVLAFDGGGALVESDGTADAVGVLLYNTPDAAVDQEVVYLSRHAEVDGSLLFGTVNAKVKADLNAVGIVVR